MLTATIKVATSSDTFRIVTTVKLGPLQHHNKSASLVFQTLCFVEQIDSKYQRNCRE